MSLGGLRESFGELCCVHEILQGTFMLPLDYCHEAGVASRPGVKRLSTIAMGASDELSGNEGCARWF
jgi:hypothetical protein